MKKNKMLLGAALLTFAIGSAFVTKAANQKQQIAVWYFDSDGNCQQGTTAKNCSTGGTGCTDNEGTSGVVQLYTENCAQPLHE